MNSTDKRTRYAALGREAAEAGDLATARAAALAVDGDADAAAACDAALALAESLAADYNSRGGRPRMGDRARSCRGCGYTFHAPADLAAHLAGGCLEVSP